jgi:Tfp pilus assembly PilM family ATPase
VSGARTLPLGIDVGAARTRVALVERDRSGATHLVAVAARATGGDAAAAIAAARAELGTRERRCVLAVGGADTLLRTSAFPGMRGAERVRAARYETARFLAFPVDDAVVRVVPFESDRCVVAVARRAALAQRVSAARSAGLRPVAIDDAALALTRVFPLAGAIVDVGERSTMLVLPSRPVPACRAFAGGGAALTAAVIASLGVDEAAAEIRKRSIGLAGAGEYARDALIEQLASALVEHRSHARTELDGIVLLGNGSRLGGFAEALERAVALSVHLATLPPDISRSLPADVVRSAAPDWALAYGLALWEHAA